VRLANAVLQMARPYSSLLTFLSILVPVWARTDDLSLSLREAAPLLFVSICTFLINDLDDIEKDKINHPERPLPSGYVSPVFVAILYYTCLALALFTTRFCIDSSSAAFLYYLLLTMCISYGYVVEYLPGVKALYVAAASSIPVLILVAYFPNDIKLYRVAVALFSFMLGRELCKDLLDRPGDPISFLHNIEPQRIATFAFAAQGAGLILLSLRIVARFAIVDLLLMIALLVLSYLCWFTFGRQRSATALMKVVIFLGLYFLL
jgi:geranylgeranylglycerol-phosphate geranylgeranyltransferase